MVALANAGFRAVAPDFRGYGLSDQPPNPQTTTFMDLCDDLLGILDQLAISKVLSLSPPFCVFGYQLFNGWV